MIKPRRVGVVALWIALAFAAATLALPVDRTLAATNEWLPVGSRFYDELDRLQSEGLIDTTVSFSFRPMARVDVARLVIHARRHNPDRLDHPGIVRLSREFSREFVELGVDPVAGYSAPLIDRRARRESDGAGRDAFSAGRLWLIPYLDLTYERRFDGRGRLANRSGGGLRGGIAHGGVLLYQDFFAGRFDGARKFADTLIEGTDFFFFTEDTYLSLRHPWIQLSLGRNRYALGPGRHGSLLWSQSAGPMTNLMWSASFLGGRVRTTSVHANVSAASDSRLAAHRIEWNPNPELSLAVNEVVRYSAPQWEPLYVLGLIPYSVVQRMIEQDALGDSTRSVRNNVIAGVDARWRVIPGATLYGELMLDDLTFETSGSPTRIGYQLGALAVATVAGRRLTARTELTRVHRFVYSVFYHENFIHQDLPIGFPQGPDSRTVTTSADLDFSSDWNLSVTGSQIQLGEGRLGEFFLPGPTPSSGSKFKGVVERSRQIETAARWTPRDGISIAAVWRYRRLLNAGHIAGAEEDDWSGRVQVFLRH